jgi:predicted ferric reductase
MQKAPAAGLTRLLWTIAFIVTLFVPLELARRMGGGDSMVLELSLGLALISASLLACTVVAVSRMPSLLRAIGIEEVVLVHRWLGLVATVAAVAHVVLVIVDNPANVMLLVPWMAPPRAVAATTATLGLILITVLSVYRRRWHRDYGDWQRMHRLLMAITLVATALHVLWLQHLMANLSLRIAFIMGSLVVLAVLFRRWVVRPVVSTMRPYQVTDVHAESRRTFTVSMTPSGVGALPVHEPGQFVWLRLDPPLGPGEDHPYTIASSSLEAPEIKITISGSGDFAQRLRAVATGDLVYLDGPYGSMTRNHPDLDTVMVAAGSGITPMMSILRTLAGAGDRRSHLLVAVVSNANDFMFLPELAALRKSLRLRIVPLTSTPGPNWCGPRGLVDGGVLEALTPRAGWNGVEVFVCGPGEFADSVKDRLKSLGAAPQLIHTERFDLV